MKVQNLIDILQLHCKPDDYILCDNDSIETIVMRAGSTRINPKQVHLFETTVYQRDMRIIREVL